MDTIAQRRTILIREIQALEHRFQRPQGSVLMLAVSKTKPSIDLAYAYQAGQRHFGENYCQEALKKQQQLTAFDITWHFIGPIQSNKTKDIAAHFSWVHSVGSLKIAQRLSAQRPEHLPPLNVCIQVNISGEDSKSGIKLDELADVADEISQLPKLALRGVMAIPELQQDFELQRQPYHELYNATLALNNPHLSTFSFGMSGDLAAAIMEGATIVRVGTALFGSRS